MDAGLEHCHRDRCPSFRNTSTRPHRCHQEEIAQGKLRSIRVFVPNTEFETQVQIKSQPEPILEGELFAEIKEEDSTWSIGKPTLELINSADLPADDGILYIELDKLRSVSFHPVHHISDTSTAPAHRHPSGGHTSSRIIRVLIRPNLRRKTPS